MPNTKRRTAVLDANVLYPAPLRDYLLRLAETNLYEPKWSDAIQEEWINNLLLNRPDLKPSALQKTKAAMNAAFPDANVSRYQSLIKNIDLPDANDRHVLAAAIKAKADVIVTNNLKDFPANLLKLRGIEAAHPDAFVLTLIKLDEDRCRTALIHQVESLKNPPLSTTEVMGILANCGLMKSVELLKKIV